MVGELHIIKSNITNYSATEWANLMLEKEKAYRTLHTMNGKTNEVKYEKVPYEEYMRTIWNDKPDATLQDCIDVSFASKLAEYAHMVSMYAGWIRNGKLFILNKKECFVSFLYKVNKATGSLNAKPTTVNLYTHFNPMQVDCIEETVSHDYLFGSLMNSMRYDISTDEKYLMSECERLIISSK